jgi:hypothetical protein
MVWVYKPKHFSLKYKEKKPIFKQNLATRLKLGVRLLFKKSPVLAKVYMYFSRKLQNLTNQLGFLILG